MKLTKFNQPFQTFSTGSHIRRAVSYLKPEETLVISEATIYENPLQSVVAWSLFVDL